MGAVFRRQLPEGWARKTHSSVISPKVRRRRENLGGREWRDPCILGLMASDSAGNDSEHGVSTGNDAEPPQVASRFKWWPIAAFLGVFTALNIILIVADAPTGMRLIPAGLLLAAALGATVAVLLRRART